MALRLGHTSFTRTREVIPVVLVCNQPDQRVQSPDPTSVLTLESYNNGTQDTSVHRNILIIARQATKPHPSAAG